MSEGATGLEPTIEITEADYPEIMRIVASDGEVDSYLASAGVAGDVFGDRAIKPLAFPLTGEEVTFNATTGGEIFLLTDQFRDGAARRAWATRPRWPDRPRATAPRTS